ncbi:molecular chaperone DnaJ [Synechococcus sp. CBW1006]|nr:molecular chaperone DnaJ [Synechococcus sp. CBW1006]
MRRVLSLQEISQNVLEEFARYVIANHNKKEPTLTTAAIKKAVYDHFGVGEKRTVANLRKSSRFLMETEGMEIPALSSSEGWKALYREFIGYLPSEEYQAGYGCINGVNIFQYFKPWRVFGLDPEKATQQDKKDAYYRLSKIYHPDNKETGDGRIFDLINNMYASITAEA